MDEEFAQLDRRLSGVSDRRTDLFHLIGNHKEMRRRGTNGKEVEKEIRRLDKAETKILRSFYKDREFWQDMCKEMDDDIARLEPQLRNPIVEYHDGIAYRPSQYDPPFYMMPIEREIAELNSLKRRRDLAFKIGFGH